MAKDTEQNKINLDLDFENIVPWNGQQDTGRDVRLKLERNWRKVVDAFNILLEYMVTADYLNDKYLRKDQPDTAKGEITFAEGLKTLDALWSFFSGKGTLVKDGTIQTDRIEVRQSMTVMDLIVNQLQGMAADYIFSDVGKVEYVTEIEEGIYKLTIEKKTAADILSFGENDVIQEIVNSIPAGGTDYYTCWMRPVSTNFNENTVTVVMYPDDEVPGGKNYAPVAGYNIARKGNAVIPDTGSNERAQYWMLSSREGRLQFLQNVFKPILEDYNYALTVGKLPDIEALKNLPVTAGRDVGIVAQTIVAENFYQFDWNGDIKSNKIDRGDWSLSVAQGDKPYRYIQHERTHGDGTHTYTELEQHTVYHYGCKWGCLVDKTTDEPALFCKGWGLLEGDKNYRMEIVSSAGSQFFANNVNTDLSASVTYANRTVTDVLMSLTGIEVEWIRNTGNIPSDNTWIPSYVDGLKHVVHITRDDMGAGWMSEYRNVTFTCRIAIPYGETYETVESSINVKI